MLLPLATLSDWLNNQLGDATKVIQNGVVLVITVFVAYKAFKAGGALAALLTAALVGGLCWWLVVGGGITFLGHLISDQSGSGN
jgi:hypothetical protein